MAEFLEDPSILTKDKLKSELQANDVPLPSGDHKKDVYVQLYLKHLTVLNKKKIPSPDTFSSDEEITPVISNRSRSGKKATKKTDKNRKEDVDVASLTNSDLNDQLLKFGINPGPVVASTRKLYEKRLQKLLDQPPETMPPEPETAVPETVTLKAGSSQNGNTHSTEDQYSDKEEDVLGADPEPVPVSAKPVRSHGKTAVTTRTSSRYRSKQVEETTATVDQAESEERSDLLKEMFPNEVSTPTGMIASCRRPIRGAAGRPVRPLDLWSEESLLKQRVFTSTKSEVSHSYSSPPPAPRPARRSFSIWIKLLVFLTLVATLYYVLQNVSSEQVDSCMLYLQDNVVTPILTAVGVLGQEKSAGNK